MNLRGVLTAVLLIVSTSAFAAEPPDRGTVLAAPCAGCHGTYGASPGKMTPVIGGQQQAYLKRSMQDFAAGARPGSVMTNFAKGYSDEQLTEMTGAIARWQWVGSSHAASKAVKKPADHATCAACHGARGQGNAESPRIAGQASGYLKEAMLEYKAGKRGSAAMEMFRDVSDKDLEQMAQYYARLR